jgi:hypothetical protein
MYFSDNWMFLVELEGDPPLAAKGVVPVDLSEEDDWGDIEPYRDAVSGLLGCTIGKFDKGGDERREIVQIWEYKEDKPFNGKFAFFEPVTLPKFIGRLLDAGLLFGQDEEEVSELKRKYGL